MRWTCQYSAALRAEQGRLKFGNTEHHVHGLRSWFGWRRYTRVWLNKREHDSMQCEVELHKRCAQAEEKLSLPVCSIRLRICNVAEHALTCNVCTSGASTLDGLCICYAGIGGAISAYNMTGVMSLTGDTFSNNSAATHGGILSVTDSSSFAVTITNATVTDNTVRSQPSEIAQHTHFGAEKPLLCSTLFSFPAQAPQGSTVYADSGSKITSMVATIDNSSVACNSCLFQGPGDTSFANLTSSGAAAASPSTNSGSGGSSLSGGAIAGIIIGALAGVALVLLLAWLLLRRRKDTAAKKDVEMAKSEKPQVTSAKNRLPPGSTLCNLSCHCRLQPCQLLKTFATL